MLVLAALEFRNPSVKNKVPRPPSPARQAVRPLLAWPFLLHVPMLLCPPASFHWLSQFHDCREKKGTVVEQEFLPFLDVLPSHHFILTLSVLRA